MTGFNIPEEEIVRTVDPAEWDEEEIPGADDDDGIAPPEEEDEPYWPSQEEIDT